MSLTKQQVDANYEEYRTTLSPYVSAELMAFIDGSDFKTAPASTRFHGSYTGGLCEHSLGVLKCLRYFALLTGDMYSDEQLVRSALLHDICKIGTYHSEKRNRKNSFGKWEEYDAWTVDDPYPAGHGSKSVALAFEYGTQLTRPEIMAITHHMGAYGLSGMDMTIYGSATEKCPLVLLIHWADLAESKLKPAVQEYRKTHPKTAGHDQS